LASDFETRTGGLLVGFTGLVKLDLQAVKQIFGWENHFTAFKNSFTGGCKINGKFFSMQTVLSSQIWYCSRTVNCSSPSPKVVPGV
jgi:hypothetical protein